MAVDLETIFTPMLALVIIIVGLGLGADSQVEDFKRALQNPRAIGVGFLSQYGFMPLLAFIFVRTSPVSEYQKIGIILTGASPGGTTSNLFTLWARGNVPLSITMSFCSTLAAFFMLPLMILIYIESLSSATVDIPWGQIFASLILIALPTTIGLYIRKKNTTWKPCGRFAWEWMKIATSVFGMVFVFGALAVALILHYEKLRDAETIFWVLAFAMEPLGALFGYSAAKLMNLSSRDARTIALECGVQNFAFTMVMITLSFGTGDDADDALLFPVMYGIAYIINSSWLVAFFRFYLARGDEDGDDESGEGQISKDLFKDISMGKYPREGSVTANKLLAARGIQLIATNVTTEELHNIKRSSA